MARTSLGGDTKEAPQASPSTKTLKAREASKAQWIEELDQLRKNASKRFGDVAWSSESDGSDLLWSHKGQPVDLP